MKKIENVMYAPTDIGFIQRIPKDIPCAKFQLDF